MDRTTELTSVPRESWSSPLTVDEENPFFFDHPLDHVPGMLILDTVLQYGERVAWALSGGAFARVTDLTLRFNGLCEKDLPATVELSRTGTGACELKANVVQEGHPVCSGFLREETQAVPDSIHATHQEPSRRAEPELVHKRDPAGVLVGIPSTADSERYRADFIPPSQGSPAGVHPVTLLAEAGRQLSTMASHLKWDIPLEWQYLLSEIRLTVSHKDPWPAAPDLVCYVPPRRGRGRGTLGVEVRSDDVRFARMEVDARAVSPGTYKRMRDAGKQTGKEQAARTR